jgi:hypothetical protein
MKQLLLSLMLLTINSRLAAQQKDTTLVGHTGQVFFVLKEGSHYFVEYLNPLKYNCAIYDTLLPMLTLPF